LLAGCYWNVRQLPISSLLAIAPPATPGETEKDHPAAADQHDRRRLGLEDNGNAYGDILPIDTCNDDGIPV